MNYLLFFIWIFFLVSAFNSANNLFYLVFSLFTAFFAAPALIARGAARGLKINFKPSGPIFCGGSGESVAAEILNCSGSEKFMLEFEAADYPSYGVETLKLPYLEPGCAKNIKFRFNFKKRGALILKPFTVKSAIPLLIGRGGSAFDAGRHFIVFPEIAPVRLGQFRGGARRSARKSAFNSDYGELSEFKDYSAGDSPAKINWRHYSVAKTLIVPQNNERLRSQYSILLLLPQDHAAGSAPYELAVSSAASLAKALSDRRASFNLITVSDKVKALSSKSATAEKMLSHLALLEHNRGISRAALSRAVKSAHDSSGVFVISSQSFDGLDYLNKFFKDRLRKIIITAGDAATPSPAAASGRTAVIASLENLSGIALR
ncbi:MAG: hypothetical protein BWY32_01181 [bacterium ADurb.Bin243]|nr:MAG: hypothetical protein BWY32_01181 [bacterium ADurb.Bin243]